MRPSQPKHRFWRVWGVSGERRESRQSDRRRAGRSAWVLPAAERRAPQACWSWVAPRSLRWPEEPPAESHPGRWLPQPRRAAPAGAQQAEPEPVWREPRAPVSAVRGRLRQTAEPVPLLAASGGAMVSARLTSGTRRAVHHDRSLIERGNRFGLWRIAAGQRNTWPRRCRPQQQLWQRACSGDHERHHRNRAAPEPLLDHALSPRGTICPGANQPVAKSQPRQGITSRRRECGAPWPSLRRSRDDRVAYGEPRTTPSRKNTRYGVVPLALPSLARQRPFVHSVPPCAGTASNSTLLW